MIKQYFYLFLFIFFTFSLHADIRKIIISAEVTLTDYNGNGYYDGHIADDLDTSEIHGWGFNGIMDAGEVLFYPYSTQNPSFFIDIPMDRVIKKRITGCEWYKLSHVPNSGDNDSVKFVAPQFLAEHDVDIKWENPWAHTVRNAYIEFVPSHPATASLPVRHYFF